MTKPTYEELTAELAAQRETIADLRHQVASLKVDNTRLANGVDEQTEIIAQQGKRALELTAEVARLKAAVEPLYHAALTMVARRSR